MNILLWVLQVLAALLYGSSGVMKAFMSDKVSQDIPSFGALPKKAWMTLGIPSADRPTLSPTTSYCGGPVCLDRFFRFLSGKIVQLVVVVAVGM